VVLRPSFNKPISTQNKCRTLFAVFKFAIFWRKTICQCLRSLLTNSDGHPSPLYPARLSSISAYDVLSFEYTLPMFETPPEKNSFFLPICGLLFWHTQCICSVRHLYFHYDSEVTLEGLERPDENCASPLELIMMTKMMMMIMMMMMMMMMMTT